MKNILFIVALVSLASCTKNAFGDDVVPQPNAGISLDELAVDTLLPLTPEAIIVEDIVVN